MYVCVLCGERLHILVKFDLILSLIFNVTRFSTLFIKSLFTTLISCDSGVYTYTKYWSFNKFLKSHSTK